MEEIFNKQSDKNTKHEDWKLPQSTENKIIIPSNMNSCTFSKDAYIHEYLGDLITQDDFNEIINQCNKLMIESWKEDRRNEIVDTPPLISNFSRIATLSLFAYSILTLIGLNVDNNSMIYLYSASSILLVGSFMFLIAGYINFKRDFNKSKTFNQLLKSYIDNYFKKLNATFNGLLFFSFVPFMNYIELKILKHFEKGDDEEVARMKKKQQYLLKRKQEIELKEIENREKMKAENISVKKSEGGRRRSIKKKSDKFSSKDKGNSSQKSKEK